MPLTSYDSYEKIRQIREDKIHENNKNIGVTGFLQANLNKDRKIKR